jgi:hypothetical protein
LHHLNALGFSAKILEHEHDGALNHLKWHQAARPGSHLLVRVLRIHFVLPFNLRAISSTIVFTCSCVCDSPRSNVIVHPVKSSL